MTSASKSPTWLASVPTSSSGVAARAPSSASSRRSIKSVAGTGLPPVVVQLAREEKGLVLVTGPTGSGKSTTLAAMVDLINTERHAHILTIEDPIEFVHPHKKLPGQPARDARPHRDVQRRSARPRCARTRMSSWSVRCAIWRRSPWPSRRRRPATSYSAPSTRRAPLRPLTGSSTSFRLTSSRRYAPSFRSRCKESSHRR